MRYYLKVVLLSLFFVISIKLTHGQKSFVLPYELQSFEIYIDSLNLPFDSIKVLTANYFHRYRGETLHRKQHYWIKFKISNSTPPGDYFIYFNSLISNIKLYQPNTKDVYTAFYGGSLVPEKKRSAGGFMKDKIPFSVKKGLKQPFFICLSTELEHSFTLENLEIVSQDKFQSFTIKAYCIQSFFLGALAIIFILNLTLFVLTKDKLYLFYFIYVLSVAIYFMFLYQLSEKFLFPKSPRLDLEISTALTISPLIYIWFFTELIQRENKLKWKRILKQYAVFVSGLTIILLVISVFDYHLYMKLNDYFLLINAGFILLTFIILYRKVSSTVQLILVGSLFMVVGGVISTIADFSKISTSHVLYYQSGVFIELIFFTIAINFIYNSERISKIKLQLKNSELLASKLQREKEARVLKTQIDEKNRELTSKAIAISQKEEAIKDVISQLNNLNYKEFEENPVRSVISRLRSNLSQNNWEEFDVLFRQVHPDFYNSLNQKYPGLSLNDKKICAFLKLNLSTKEICEITGKSINSIDVARYRLRQKMHLKSDENLASIISSL